MDVSKTNEGEKQEITEGMTEGRKVDGKKRLNNE
jgi:hypothetical protein